jgi:hypothetical protein
MMETELSVVLDTTIYRAAPAPAGPCVNTSILCPPVATNAISLRRVSDGTAAVNVEESNANNRSFFAAAATFPARM